jgi:hypothetical protein
MNKSTTARTNAKTVKPASPRRVRKTLGVPNTAWKAVGDFLNNRSRDLALTAIVLAAFVAVFEGSLYSAREFAFTGWSAYAFAVMPDALMVLSAAKMRQTGISAAQHHTAKVSMYYGLVFSLLTNMIAAFLKYAPQGWVTPIMLLTGAIVYHGVVVIFLWRAVETLTKTRADRRNAKAPKASEAPAPAVQAIPVHTASVSWSDTLMANLSALVKPMGRKA